MFTKNSRYYALDDIVINNDNNRQIKAKTIRLIDKVEGVFEHLIDENDRLDLLAKKYYDQPIKWWRICDANPEFKSPLDLLGQGVLHTYRFYLLDEAIPAPFSWLELTNPLADVVGIENLKTVDKVVALQQETTEILGEEVLIDREVYERYLDITINSSLITIEMIVDILADSSTALSAPELRSRIGKKIIIPPAR